VSVLNEDNNYYDEMRRNLSDWDKLFFDVILYEIEKEEFSLNDLLKFIPYFKEKYPNNNNLEPKIRHVLQRLRDLGILYFLDNRDNYKKEPLFFQPRELKKVNPYIDEFYHSEIAVTLRKLYDFFTEGVIIFRGHYEDLLEHAPYLYNVNVKIKMHNFAQIIMYKNAKLISFRF